MNGLVVIVTLNYNQNEYTLKCIDSLLKLNYKKFKILLVENGSSKKNKNYLVENLPISEKLIVENLENNIGYSQGTNYGLECGLKYDPKYFLIINNDTIIDKSALDQLVTTCLNFDNKVLVTGKVYHYDKPNELQLVGYQFKNKKLLTFKKLGVNENDSGQFDSVSERDMIDDIFVLQPSSVFKKFGGYSPYLWINGVNVELGLKVKKEGYKLIYTPNAKIWHKGSVSFGGRSMNPKLAYWNIQSHLIVRYLSLSKWNFTIFYLMTLKSILGTGIKAIFSNESNYKNYSKAKYYGLLYFNEWVFKKNKNSGFNPF